MEKVYLIIEHMHYDDSVVISVHKKEKNALKKMKELTKGWKNRGVNVWESLTGCSTIYLQEMDVEE